MTIELGLVDLSSAYDTGPTEFYLQNNMTHLKTTSLKYRIPITKRRWNGEGKIMALHGKMFGLASSTTCRPMTNQYTAIQNTSFEQVEYKFELALGTIWDYYRKKLIKPHSVKTQVILSIYIPARFTRECKFAGMVPPYYTERLTYLDVVKDSLLT